MNLENPFKWNDNRRPSMFLSDRKFTWNAEAVATNARLIGTGLVAFPNADSINTDKRLPADKRAGIRRGGI